MTACLLYQIKFRLSRTFFIFFRRFFISSQRFRNFFWPPLLRSSLFSISNRNPFVKNFFQILFHSVFFLSDFVQGFLYSLRFLSEGTILQKASGFCVWIFAVGLTLFPEGTILQRIGVFAGFLLREPSSKRLFVDWLLPGSILTSLQTVALLRSAPDHQGNWPNLRSNCSRLSVSANLPKRIFSRVLPGYALFMGISPFRFLGSPGFPRFSLTFHFPALTCRIGPSQTISLDSLLPCWLAPIDRRKLLFLPVLSGFSLRIRTARPVHKPFVLERPLSLARLPTISDARGDPRRQTVWNNAPHSRCTPEPPPFCSYEGSS